jgi:hypothetical protein
VERSEVECWRDVCAADDWLAGLLLCRTVRCWIWRAGVCGLAVGDGEEVGRCVAAGLLSVCWSVVGGPVCEAIVLAFVACKLCWTAQARGFTLLDRQSHGDDEQKTGHFW